MAYRKILVPVFGIPTDRLSLSSAFGIAKQFGSHVEALFVRPDPLRTAPYGGIETGIGGVAVQYAIESAIKAADAAQRPALQHQA
jgi:hypothetical protein